MPTRHDDAKAQEALAGFTAIDVYNASTFRVRRDRNLSPILVA